MQEHLREIWNFGKDIPLEYEDESSEDEKDNTEEDLLEIDSELEELAQESQESSQNKLEIIRKCIHEVTLPTHIHRPPSNLGEKSHGRLKADEYLVLFSFIFPLIIPTFWHPSDSDYTKALLHNFYDLVVCTNIIAMFSTSNAKADQYMTHYISYRKGLKDLFPTYKVKPNHHYALHNGELLKYWGPLSALSEFPGERMNGIMQNIQTNRRICMYSSIIQLYISQYYVKHVVVEDWNPSDTIGKTDNSATNQLMTLLMPKKKDPSQIPSTQPLTSYEEAVLIAKSPRLSNFNYELLFTFLQAKGQPWRRYNAFPHPENSLILSPFANHPMQITYEGHVYSCYRSHQGNSAIQVHTGVIDSIWTLPLDGFERTFFLMHLYNVKSPYHNWPQVNAELVAADLSDPTLLIIEPNQIITHLATYKLPAGTYGIDQETLAICWSLNRGRK
ncbi:hypothetical protein K435DRAFT_819951 [Dendrothele bispora CBS 962.96]|uniref:Uncharacterized protein n=1 Tax=Dendrothele bispora (strain CBS 962.96) TaxID=1314807 RepID=A0A4S8LY93_DENBC|nr:hypothetical protein K435DRAFT_819951 [Dendrothele bispora CBS 962.96]